MTVSFAGREEIDGWMALIEKVKEAFPGMENTEALEEHRKTVLDFMQRKCAICAWQENKIVGVLLFSPQENTLCFLAVDEEYRRQGIAKAMFELMMKHMDRHRDISLLTYRENDCRGTAARRFYIRMGFSPGRLTEEFGSPVQEFVLKR